MKNTKPAEQPAVTIEQLYPELTPEQQQEAAYWLGRYLAVVRRIFERNEALTASKRTDTL